MFAGAPLIKVVAPKKILGANYGFPLMPAAVLNSSLESPRFGRNFDAGFGDTYFQSISRGWKSTHSDIVAGFAIYALTGRYTAGNPGGDNPGLGMRGIEPSKANDRSLEQSRDLECFGASIVQAGQPSKLIS
jgi:hypothetical protein